MGAVQRGTGNAQLQLLAPPDAAVRRPRILCVMRMPPDRDGHGGSQRAWHLIEALRRQGEVHFVLMFRDQDQDCMATSLAPLAGRVASVTRINIPDWQTADAAKLRVIHPRLWDLMRVRSIEAPRFSHAVLRRIAASLPLCDPDLVFAGRLCCAVMLQDLMEHGLLRSPRRLVDFDDIMSTFRRRQAANASVKWKGYYRVSWWQTEIPIAAPSQRCCSRSSPSASRLRRHPR
jgi:polysaccharide biosynthesis protein PslH